MSRGAEHNEWAKAVRERDARCMFCGSAENLAAHHMLTWERHEAHRLDLQNGITVCAACHAHIHTAGGRYGKDRLLP